MNPRATEIRDTLLLSAATVLGVLVSPGLAIIGLPLVAAGVAGLAYRGRIVNAAIAMAIGVAAVSVVSLTDLIYVIPALAAVMFAVVALSRIDVQWVGAPVVLVLSLAGAAHEYVVMRAAHETPLSFANRVVSLMSNGQPLNAATQQTNRELANLFVTLMPTEFFFAGFLTTIAVILAIAWAAKRSGRTLKVSPLARLDLTPHMLWPFILGLLALAASYGPVPYASTLSTVGLNLLLCTRALFALQGFAVAAGVLDRTGVGLGGRIFVLAALAALDVFTLSVSLLGLLDFWINFRRLPRDGATPPSPTTPTWDR